MELMLENMVVGRPPGTYDRLLDFTHPVTGGLFFAPSLDFLAALASDDAAPDPVSAAQPSASQSSASPSSAGQSTAGEPPATPPTAPAQTARRGDGSLNIGSLKGTSQHG
jgi:putative iron-dependent peroxidase